MSALAPALPFIALGSAGLGAAAAARQTQAVAAQTMQQQRVELRNVDIAKRDAQTFQQDTLREIARFRQLAGEQISTTRTRLAKSGVDLSMGTGLLIQKESANRIDDQIAEITLDRLRKQQAIEEQQTGAEQRALLAGMSARTYRDSILPTAGASLLTGTTRFATTAKKYGVLGFKT